MNYTETKVMKFIVEIRNMFSKSVHAQCRFFKSKIFCLKTRSMAIQTDIETVTSLTKVQLRLIIKRVTYIASRNIDNVITFTIKAEIKFYCLKVIVCKLLGQG